MPKTAKRHAAPASARPREQFAGLHAEARDLPEVFYHEETFQALQNACRKARRFVRDQWFIGNVLRLRLAFYHFGFKLEALDPEDQPKIDDWWEDIANRRPLADYAREAWVERLTTSNVISFWTRSSRRPLIIRPEHVVEFKDCFGEERLTITHQLSDHDIQALAGLSDAERQALRASKQLKLDHDHPQFSFEVLRDEALGHGLGWPALGSVFLAAEQSASLDVGDALLALACRRLLEIHRVGHEKRNGLNAGESVNLTEKKALAIESQFKGKNTGLISTSVNWDHAIEILRPDAKHFDPKKFASVIDRLMWWSMPLGQILTAPGYNAQWMSVFSVQAQYERALMALHLETVFQAVFRVPAAARPIWCNRCFLDARLAQELLKFGLSSGPVSQETFLEGLALDAAKERARKDAEDKLPKAQTHPLYNPALGPTTNVAPKMGNDGRKPGSPNLARNGEEEPALTE